MYKSFSRSDAIKDYIVDKSVLDLGVVQHSPNKIMAPTWLHKYIADNASKCVGVDTEQAGIIKLSKLGYRVICADVQALDLGEQFDVVVAGELIEHLHNFDGFLVSVRKHLKENGRFILTTPNSLFVGHFLAAIRNKLVIHEQHTCWFDEVTIKQLLQRYEFDIESVIYLGSRRWMSIPIPKRTTASTLMVVARRSLNARN